MPTPSASAFSIRRLNPFNGVLQVVATADARALSNNGQSWEIQVLSDSPQGLWANIPYAGQQFYTFGLWSSNQGLHRVPLNPLFNISGMLKSAQQLIDSLEPKLQQLPFPLDDSYELWLLDEDSGTPFALLDSARSEAELEHKTYTRWRAAETGDFSFASPYLSEKGLPLNDGHNPRVHASVLEALVQGRSGPDHHRAWYLRDAKRAGKVIMHQADDQPAAGFPELPVSLDWHEAEDHRLIMDYVSWKAPLILLLPGLAPATRAMLEGLAVKNPALIDRLWRLLPEINNKTLLNKARIEARIRLSNTT